MPLPTVSPAVEIVAEALALRRKHLGFPALDTLDKVMRGRQGQHIDFGVLAVPPAPFAFLIVEALDSGMPRCDWEGLWRGNSHPNVRPFLLKVWMEEVWPKFRGRYALN